MYTHSHTSPIYGSAWDLRRSLTCPSPKMYTHSHTEQLLDTQVHRHTHTYRYTQRGFLFVNCVVFCVISQMLVKWWVYLKFFTPGTTQRLCFHTVDCSQQHTFVFTHISEHVTPLEDIHSFMFVLSAPPLRSSLFMELFVSESHCRKRLEQNPTSNQWLRLKVCPCFSCSQPSVVFSSQNLCVTEMCCVFRQECCGGGSEDPFDRSGLWIVRSHDSGVCGFVVWAVHTWTASGGDCNPAGLPAQSVKVSVCPSSVFLWSVC